MRLKYHNIALVQLKDSVRLAFNIWPACLIPENNFMIGANLLIAGFGRDDVKDGRSSYFLNRSCVLHQTYQLGKHRHGF